MQQCTAQNLFHHQVHDERNRHTDAANADESLDELVAFLALRKAAEVTAEPGTCRHNNRDRPVDFSGNAECDGTYNQEHVRECVLDGVHVNWVKSGVSRESENLYETDADLNDAAVDGNSEESEEIGRASCRERV